MQQSSYQPLSLMCFYVQLFINFKHLITAFGEEPQHYCFIGEILYILQLVNVEPNRNESSHIMIFGMNFENLRPKFFASRHLFASYSSCCICQGCKRAIEGRHVERLSQSIV